MFKQNTIAVSHKRVNSELRLMGLLQLFGVVTVMDGWVWLQVQQFRRQGLPLRQQPGLLLPQLPAAGMLWNKYTYGWTQPVRKWQWDASDIKLLYWLVAHGDVISVTIFWFRSYELWCYLTSSGATKKECSDSLKLASCSVRFNIYFTPKLKIKYTFNWYSRLLAF